MKHGWVVSAVLSVGVVFAAYGLVKGPHRFSRTDCRMCHADADKDAGRLKPILSSTCEKCHRDIRQNQSHPVDIPPEVPIPADMPLMDGKLTCVTCHFVHPSSLRHRPFSKFLLRRPGRGVMFCSACHDINEKGHLVFENVHLGSYRVTDRRGTIDQYTLQCIECHDRYLGNPKDAVGVGVWNHFATKLNHPVGVSYVRIAARKPREFNPSTALPEEIRLFDGKIGCGTCHNVFSKEKDMLVMNNRGSRLCLECHIK